MNDSKLAKDLIEAVKRESGTKPYDTTATVLRVQNGIVWVHIDGGAQETPCQMTMNAKEGDVVKVRVSGGQAWLIGNRSAPPTDDKKANEADEKAEAAYIVAGEAQDEAERAHAAADTAQDEAERAHTAADTAQEDAETASEAAISAYNSAYNALHQLGVVEDVVGVLALVSKNGDYQQTADTTADADKWYFTRSGSAGAYTYTVQRGVTFTFQLTSDTAIVQGKPYYTRTGEGTEDDPYVYVEVGNPVVADIGTYYDNTSWGYYELVGIDQSIQNYVSDHLVLSGGSLYLQNDNRKMLELSSTKGVILYDQDGKQLAQYGTETIIGDLKNFGIKIGESPDSTQQKPVYELGFYQDGKRVAYINNNSLYITQTVVLKQMQMGDALGVWAWCVHTLNNQNNLYLKWLG